MSDNPYQAPEVSSDATGVLSGTRDDLRSVAVFQKGILVCILIYFVAVIGQFAMPAEIRPLAGSGILLNGLVGAVFVFLLAIKTYGTGLGIGLGILSLIPCVGLFVC